MVLKSLAERLGSAMLVVLVEEVMVLVITVVGHHPLHFSYSVVSRTSMVHLITFLRAMTDTIR